MFLDNLACFGASSLPSPFFLIIYIDNNYFVNKSASLQQAIINMFSLIGIGSIKACCQQKSRRSAALTEGDSDVEVVDNIV